MVAFFVFGGITLLLWQKQTGYERSRLFRHTESIAEQIRIRVEGLMNARIASLELLAERWVGRRPADFSQERFFQFANTYYEYFPGFTEINWIEPEGFIRWVSPRKIDAEAKDRSVYENPDSRYSATFDRVRDSLQHQLTPCLKVFQGGMGFDAFLPLLYDGRIQGYLNGVFQIDRLMDICLAKDVLTAFVISIYEGNQLIYHQGGQGEKGQRTDGVPVVREIRFSGKTWRLHLVSLSSPSAGNLSVLMFGMTLSVGLALLLHFLLQRMEMLTEARDRALHEVSERKRVEEILLKNEKKLEGLLGELAEKNAELEAFVYTVSHDLKTPIVTIEGFVGALREDFGDQLSEQGEGYLRFMSDAARKMEVLINDLLELSRVGRLDQKKNRFPFADVVQETLSTLRPRIEARGIAVTVDEDLPVVYGERKRLVQVVDNLLSNAVKYIGADNPAPHIHVGVAHQDGRKAFFVRDNGIGIEERYFQKVFQIFQRLPSAAKLVEGTGIGLTIVQRIVERHGGKIWLTSVPGQGTTFFFTLEAEEAQT